MGNESTQNKRGNNPHAAKIGGVFILLAIIGLIAVVVFSINLTSSLLDNTKQLEEFEQFLAPVVMFDPVPFDSVENADQIMLLQSALMQTRFSEKRENYVYDDNGMIVIPASDIDIAAKTLFGSNVSLFHQSFGDFENVYTYDEADNVYRVPLLIHSGYYSPMVEKITKSGKQIILRVGYIPSGSTWLTDPSGRRYAPTPDKYMNYTLEKDGKNYVIVSITDSGDVFGTVKTHE